MVHDCVDTEDCDKEGFTSFIKSFASDASGGDLRDQLVTRSGQSEEKVKVV